MLYRPGLRPEAAARAGRIGFALRARLDAAEVLAAVVGAGAVDPWQRAVLRGFADGEDLSTLKPGPRSLHRVLICAGRQLGKSTVAGALITWRLLVDRGPHGTGCTVLAVAPSLRTASELLGKVRQCLTALGVPLDRDAATSITLANGSRVVALPGSATAARGWSPALVVLDELAFCHESLIHALRPALVATRGDLIGITSAGAEGSWARQTWEAARWTRVEVPWSASPRLAARPEEIEELRASMPRHVFETEMECRWGGAGTGLFDAALVAQALGSAGLSLPVVTPLADRLRKAA